MDIVWANIKVHMVTDVIGQLIDLVEHCKAVELQYQEDQRNHIVQVSYTRGFVLLTEPVTQESAMKLK